MKHRATALPDRNEKPVLRRKATAMLALSLLLQACGGEDEVAASGDNSLQVRIAATSNCTAFPASPIYSGQVPPPPGSSELKYKEEIIPYLDELDRKSNRVVTGVVATSIKGQPIRYAIVGREDRLTLMGLDAVRRAIAQLADPDTSVTKAAALAASMPAILWVSANVHGNEESGADASLRVLYDLADREDCAAARIRDNALVVILPVQNPDGRELNTRRNANGFDLNRDWFARTQPETEGKLELLRQYRPVLHVDAHETSLNHYFFPPTADPTYHEVPQTAFDWINKLYSPAIAAEFDRQKIAYFHGAPYDLYAAEYSDSVTTLGFHAAGMTFEKYSGASITTRVNEHYTAMWSSLFAAASNKTDILNKWYGSHVEARTQGANGQLQPNGVYYDAKSLYQQVPGETVRHYFLLRDSDPERATMADQLVRRLQRMDVKVWQLQAQLEVPDYHAYGGSVPGSRATIPAGSYWIPMAQAQKHWIQAMLHHDPYIPVSVSYDVSAWSNPLLMNLDGGSSGVKLKPNASLVPPVPAPPRPPASALRLGLFEIPGSSGFESAGAARHLLEQVWGVSYTDVRPDNLAADLGQIDVLLVPDGYANAALQALGSKGQKALADWVTNGGRYVGYLGGTELAIKAGISTAVLSASHTAAPGTLIKVGLEAGNPLAKGMSQAWIMYNDDAVMQPGLGMAAASFPAGAQKTSGLAIGVDELAGSAAVIDEQVGSGRSIVFSFDPNFRAWTEGTQRILRNALFYNTAPAPTTMTAQASVTRQDAIDAAKRAVKALPDAGKAIRIVVRPVDADATRALLQRYGADFRESSKGERTVFMIANREGLDREEHPYALQLERELRSQLKPISFSMP